MKDYVINVFWFAIDKVFVLLGGLIATIVVARYLGPEQLGKITLGIALSGLCVALGQWGANHTIFDGTLKYKKNIGKVIVSSEKARFIVYIATWLMITIVIYSIDSYREDVVIISLAILSGLFLSLDVHQFYYNAILSNKINATTNLWGKLSSTLVRVIFVWAKLDTVFFVIPYFINNFILYYFRRGSKKNITKSKLHLKWFFKKGQFFALTATLTFVHLKINELLLSHYSDFSDLACYSIGMALAFSWTFLPLAIGNGLFRLPTTFKDKEKANKYFSFIFSGMLIVSLPVVIFFEMFSSEIIDLTLGDDYRKASSILGLLCLATLCSTLNVVTSRVIGYMEGGRYLAKKILYVSFLNIPITIFLISNYAIEGAAFAILLTELLSLTIFNYFFHNGVIFKIHAKALSVSNVIECLKDVRNGKV